MRAHGKLDEEQRILENNTVLRKFWGLSLTEAVLLDDLKERIYQFENVMKQRGLL
jgi:hypothetical protein